MRGLCIMFVMISAMTLASGVRAQAVAADADATAANLAEAKRHFEQGMKAFEGRDFRTAIHEFELAVAQAPSAELWFDIARAHDELAEYDAARQAYELYLRDRVDAKDATEVRKRIDQLTRLAEAQRLARGRHVDTGNLRIQSNVDAAKIMLDGRLVGRAPLREPLALHAGSYRLDLSQPGFVPFHAEVQIEPGMLTAAYADLEPLSDAKAARKRRTPVWTWVLLAASGSLVATGGGFGAASLLQARDDHDVAAERSADHAHLALGGAALCVLAATIVYFVDGDSP